MSKRWLVTGCAGFIGNHLLRRLLADGISVVGVDDFSTGRRENLEDLLGHFEFIEGSICDPRVVWRACSGVEVVLHQAAVPSVPRSVSDPLTSLNASILGTVQLLIAARDEGVRRVVQAGSSSTYGDTPTLPKTEDMRPAPRSPYAVAKLAQEHYASAFALTYGLDTATLRYFNVFGPRQDPNNPYAAVIPKFIQQLSRGERPVIFGDGEQSRDFTYIDNVVSANLAAARHPEPLGGEVFNAALGDRHTLNSLIRELNAILGTDIEPTYAPGRKGEVRDSQAGVDKIYRTLGWRGDVPFSEGLRRTAAWFRDRP